MAKPVEENQPERGPLQTMYRIDSPKNRTESTLRVELPGAVDYSDMADYIRSWPDKLVSFVVERLCDDDMALFVRELYEYICWGDHDGPPYEEWRRS